MSFIYADKSLQFFSLNEAKTALIALASIMKAVFDAYIYYLLIRNLRFFVGKYTQRNKVDFTLYLWRLFIAFMVFSEIFTSLVFVFFRSMTIPYLLPIRNLDGFIFGAKLLISLLIPFTNFLESLSIVILLSYLCK